MSQEPLRIVILGLSVTSSWGNGHATTYRALLRALDRQGHAVLFLERDVPWYAAHRDLPQPAFGRTELYGSLGELTSRFVPEIREADAVILGSYVPEGTAVADWILAESRGVTAFYDIDTPVTLAQIAGGTCDYLTAQLIPRFDLYLSFSGGASLQTLMREYGAQNAQPLYCSVDTDVYFPEGGLPQIDLGYLGTYSDDRQPALERLLAEPARQWPEGRFSVAGAQYPEDLTWPPNVQRTEHLPPAFHRSFYCDQRFTLNITRADMVRAGHSPSVRLFEAAACATPVVSDAWPGLDHFFAPGREILLAESPEEVIQILRRMPEERRREIGERARQRVLLRHTAEHRAEELAGHLRTTRESVARRRSRGASMRNVS